MLRVVLEIAQHLGEVGRPFFQAEAVLRWDAEHFCGYDSRQRLGKVTDYIHASLRLNLVEKLIHNLPNMRAQFLDACRSKSFGREAAKASVRPAIHEQHQLHHKTRDRAQASQPDSLQLFWSRRTGRRKRMQNLDHILVAGDDPGMQERVPVHGGLVSQAMKQRIRVSQNRRVEKVIQTERPLGLFQPG